VNGAFGKKYPLRGYVFFSKMPLQTAEKSSKIEKSYRVKKFVEHTFEIKNASTEKLHFFPKSRESEVQV